MSFGRWHWLILSHLLRCAQAEVECRCTRGCDVNFRCLIGGQCKKGWSGPTCQRENIALGKTATQGGTYRKASPDLAVDGNRSLDFYSETCSHTNEKYKATWSVDLGRKHHVKDITIYLTYDYRMKEFRIRVDDSLCLEWKPAYPRKPEDISCNRPLYGRNVTMDVLVFDGENAILAICEFEVYVCSDGWFGDECDRQCKCYNHTEVCDKISGQCTSGCAAGVMGTDCQTQCDDGWFGVNCNTRCRCNDVLEACAKLTGHCKSGCPDGSVGEPCVDVRECHCRGSCVLFPEKPCPLTTGHSCEDGWFGPYCQKENVALGRPTYQSSTYSEVLDSHNYTYPSSYAVDGISTNNFYSKPHTCSHTDGRNSHWTVRLNKTVSDRIRYIKLYLPSGYNNRKTGMVISVDNKTCFEWPSDGGPHDIADVTCQKPLSGNTVTITRPADKTIITLCEVQIFICGDGWFGDECDKQCHCHSQVEVCDKITGQCTSGCAAGFTGPGCQADCEDGAYGFNCSLQCGRCMGGTACGKVKGECSGGCEEEFQLPLCQAKNLKGTKIKFIVPILAGITGLSFGVIILSLVIVITCMKRKMACFKPIEEPVRSAYDASSSTYTTLKRDHPTYTGLKAESVNAASLATYTEPYENDACESEHVYEMEELPLSGTT